MVLGMLAWIPWWWVTCGIDTQLRAMTLDTNVWMRDIGFMSTGPNWLKSMFGQAGSLSSGEVGVSSGFVTRSLVLVACGERRDGSVRFPGDHVSWPSRI